MKIYSKIIEMILNTLGTYRPECGGVLGAGEDGVITHYYFDSTGKSEPKCYTPDVEAINRVLTEEWFPKGIFMVGIVHSHDAMNPYPSCGDVSYGINILRALDTTEKFFLPILTVENDEMNLQGYVIETDEVHGYVCRAIEVSVVE